MERLKKNNTGITIIALVITIVVLLILAGISINLVVGNNGIITKANDAKNQTIRAAEKSAVDLAASYLKMTDTIDNTNSLNASNLKTEIEKNYGQNTVDVKGSNILIVTFKETGNKYIVNADGTVIEMDATEFELVYYVKIHDGLADIILIPIYKTETNDSVEILCPDESTLNVIMGEEAIYTVNENGTYTFVGKYGENTSTKQVEVNGISQIADIKDEDIETTINPSNITNQDVEVTIKNKKTEYILQYSLNKTDWVDYSQSIIMKQNGVIYVRLAKDSESSGNHITINITNIDKLPPNDFTPTATSTTNSITLTGSTTDAEKTSTNGSSGIQAYYFSKDNGATWVGGTTATSFKFTGLSQGRNYSLKMKAVDNVGNERITSTVSKKTESVAGLTSSNTTFEYSPTTWTRGSVYVTITTTVTGYTLQYSLDATSWKNYEGAVPRTENGPIYARVVDSTSQSATGYATGNVTIIDKLPPNDFTPTATSTTNSITLTGSTTDAEKTSTNGSSGIQAYYFSKDNGATWVGGTESTSYTFTGLSQETTYSLRMKAVDNAGNELITETLSQEIVGVIPTFTYTGKYVIVNDDDTTYTTGNENWKIRFLTSGTLTMNTDVKIDAFLVGGGGGGGSARNTYKESEGKFFGDGGGGGGGGYTTTAKEITLTANTSYNIRIGAGGYASTNGGTTSAFSQTAKGGGAGGSSPSVGEDGTANVGAPGTGGSNGGSGGYYASRPLIEPGSDGSPGQGTTTREFSSSNGKLYAGGGAGGMGYNGNVGYSPFINGGAGGGGGSGVMGTPNTGGGGGGGCVINNKTGTSIGAAGGSGIVVIRNAR